MSGLSGNRGEWSEVYAFFRIIAEGRLYGADGDTKKRDDIFYDVNKILRQENEKEIEYIISDDEKKAIVKSGDNVIVEIEKIEFSREADYLFDLIKNTKGPTFSSERTENFMSKIKCYKIKAPSKDKSDITIEIHDPRTNLEHILGFSIKSKLGHPSTLLNPGKTTNFKFSINGNIDPFIDEDGEIKTESGDKRRITLSDKFSMLVKKGITFDYSGMDNDTFFDNLSMIDSKMDHIVAEMLKLHYINGISNIKEQAAILEKTNPLNFKSRSDSNFYSFKIKKFLAAVALGMKPASVWDGTEDANGGYIIVKEDGEVLCYHIYNRNDFENYLFNNTVLDTPSTTRYEFANIMIDEKGQYFVKLNLQIRFK